MAIREDKNCTTCGAEDTPNDEYPCNKCDPRWFSEWHPKQEGETDLYDM